MAQDLSNVPWDEFPLNADPADRVCKNFKVYELTKSNTAIHRNIDNSFPTAEICQNAVYMTRMIMQKVRTHYGEPIKPNSTFRSQELERVLKRKPDTWTSTSQHTKGQACDIEVPGRSNKELAEWIRDNLEFDQLILEKFNPDDGPNSGWVHVSIVAPGRGTNRQKTMSYIKSATTGRYVYVLGIVTDKI